ncbi:unnamed protein product, partial [marine sediment metagenome]
MGKHYGLDIPTLSELLINVDKEWVDQDGQPRGISNIKEIAEAMAIGHISQRNGTKLIKLAPGASSLVLTSQGPGHLVVWAPGGTYFHRYFPVTIDLAHSAALFTPDYEKLLTAPMTSTYTQTIIPTEAPALALEAAAALFTPDYSSAETGPLVSAYQAEAHVADAFGHFSVGANSVS